MVHKKYSQQFSGESQSTSWVTIPASKINYVRQYAGSVLVLDVTAGAVTYIATGENQFIEARWLRNGTTSLGNTSLFQIASSAGGLQGRGQLALLPYVDTNPSPNNNTYAIQIKVYTSGSKCFLNGRAAITEYRNGIISTEPSAYTVEENAQEFEITEEEKTEYKRTMLDYERKMKKIDKLEKRVK